MNCDVTRQSSGCISACVLTTATRRTTVFGRVVVGAGGRLLAERLLAARLAVAIPVSAALCAPGSRGHRRNFTTGNRDIDTDQLLDLAEETDFR